MNNRKSLLKFASIGCALILLIILLIVIFNGDDESTPTQTDTNSSANDISKLPPAIKQSFPRTDFTKRSVELDELIPAVDSTTIRDSIPAINNPKFQPIADFPFNDSVLAAVFMGKEGTVRVYPYNIMVWHEIVNDEVDGQPIAVTFCPLCGSSIVFDRTTSKGVSRFGVSGALRESNLIMYDQKTESLWQQSLGESLVGELTGEKLKLQEVQLMAVSEAEDKFPEAEVLSSDTGALLSYNQNPYQGYTSDDTLSYDVSVQDTTFKAKEIMVAFNVGETSVAIPSVSLRDPMSFNIKDKKANFSLKKEDNIVTITDDSGKKIPFYYEMWFSWIVHHQNPDKRLVVDPRIE